MLQLDLKLDNVDIIREAIYKTRGQINVLQIKEMQLKDKIKVVSKHYKKDRISKSERIHIEGRRTRTVMITYCGMCEKQITKS